MSQIPQNPRSKTSFVEGAVLLFDKPYGWTSFDVVGKVRSLIRRRLGLKKTKVGHAGTLDPLATGLLIVCTGKMTKSIDKYQALEKEYSGTFFLGQTTPSYDLETKPGESRPIGHLSQEIAQLTASQFVGTFDQIPPQFSAKKIEGERAYTFARRGEATTLKPKNISIKEFAITSFQPPQASFSIVCSKGTYIRALARDFGDALKTGAYLQSLRRESIGTFHVSDAWSIQDFEAFINGLEAESHE